MYSCTQHFKYRQEEHTVIFFLHYICSIVDSNPLSQVHSPLLIVLHLLIWLLTLEAKPSQESAPKIPLAPILNGIKNSIKQTRKLIITKPKLQGLNPVKISFLCPHEMSVTEDKKGSILPSLEQQPSGWGRNKELKAGLGPPSFPSSPTAAVPRADPGQESRALPGGSCRSTLDVLQPHMGTGPTQPAQSQRETTFLRHS